MTASHDSTLSLPQGQQRISHPSTKKTRWVLQTWSRKTAVYGSIICLCTIVIVAVLSTPYDYAAGARMFASARPFGTTARSFSPSDVLAMQNAAACGQVCSYDLDLKSPSKGVAQPLKLDCPNVFVRMASRQPAVTWPPPEEIPPELFNGYTIHGAIPVVPFYLYRRYSGSKGNTPRWDREPIDEAIAAPALYPDGPFKNFSTYGEPVSAYFETATREFAGAINGGVGIVLGSERPWVEIILARAGAKHIVTVEYGQVESKHPRLTVVTPSSFAAFMLMHPRQFDFAVTYSSLEHSGLGRYGDGLNPYGDLEAVAETWCALRPGGYFFLGLPSANPAASTDILYWNAHRHYGPLRLAQIFRGYEYIKTISTQDPKIPGAALIHVLRKPLAQ